MPENNECYLCKSDISNQSYFMRWTMEEKDIIGQLIEVCPECHHHYTYAPKDLLDKYKKRRGIKL